MPDSDLILNVRQIAGYPPVVGNAPPAGSILIQTGGLGSPYASISPEALVSTALASPGAGMFVGGQVGALSFQGGSAQFSNAAVSLLSVAQTATVRELDAQWGTIAGVPIATTEFASALVAGLQASTVWSFNGRRGDITLWIQDILKAGGAPIWSPRFTGRPMAETPAPWSNSERLATTAFVHRANGFAIDNLLATHPFVFTFNGRSGDIVLTEEDILAAGSGGVFDSVALTGIPTAPTAPPGTNTTQLATCAFVTNAVATSASSVLAQVGTIYAPLNSPQFIGTPVALTAAPGTATGQLATCAFVMNAVADSVAGVSTWNGRSGNVVLEPIDLQDAGGALINSPVFTGVPTAPTAALATNTNQVATCAFVLAELGGAAVGVMSFNGRSGAVILNESDIDNAGGAPISGPAFTGVPTAPTAASGVSTNQIATTAFVMSALTTNAGVTSFMGRTGAITLTYADVSAAGGLANPSPALTGTPTAPTAATATNTTQIATCAFVYAAIAAGTVTTFNGRAGAVTLTTADITGAGGAVLASPAFTGTPTSTTPPAANSSTRIATTAFVAAAIGTYLPLAGGVMTGGLTTPNIVVSNGVLQIAVGSATNPALYFNDGSTNRTSFYFSIANGQSQWTDNYSGANIVMGPASAINLGATTVGTTGNFTIVGTCAIGGLVLQAAGPWMQSNSGFQAPVLRGTAGTGWLVNPGSIPVVGDIANMAVVSSGSSPSGLAFQCTNAANTVAYFIWVDAGCDERIKQNIRPTEVDALGAILALPVRQFEFDQAASAALRRSPSPRVASFHVPLGLVAQECAGVIPDMDIVVPQPEGHDQALPTDLHAIVLPNAVPYLIRAIQQLEARVRELEGRTLH